MYEENYLVEIEDRCEELRAKHKVTKKAQYCDECEIYKECKPREYLKEQGRQYDKWLKEVYGLQLN